MRFSILILVALFAVSFFMSSINARGRGGGGGRSSGIGRGSSGKSGSRSSSTGSRSFSKPGANGRGGKSFSKSLGSTWKVLLGASVANRLVNGKRVKIYGDDEYIRSERYQNNMEPTLCFNKTIKYFICPHENIDNSTKEYCCEREDDAENQYCCSRDEWSGVPEVGAALYIVAAVPFIAYVVSR